MLFTHTWELVLRKQQTQTRRVMRKGDAARVFDKGLSGHYMVMADAMLEGPNPDREIVSVFYDGGKRLRFEVKRSYSVEPGFGVGGVGYIGIKEIKLHHLWDIDEAGALAELGDLAYWQKGLRVPKDLSPVEVYALAWNFMNHRKSVRWESNPPVWALTFVCWTDTPAYLVERQEG